MLRHRVCAYQKPTKVLRWNAMSSTTRLSAPKKDEARSESPHHDQSRSARSPPAAVASNPLSRRYS